MSINIVQLLTATVIGLVAGYVGSFMILRRMSLVGDALSHVALPGIAVALIYHIHPFLGAFAALFIAILGIWFLEKKTQLPSETLVGIFFTSSLALGLLLTPEPELLEALFGNISKVTKLDALISVVLTIVILVILELIHKKLILGILSKDLTQSMGIRVHAVNLLFLFLVAIVVALGLKVAGTLLMGSLVIIPAAAARNVSLGLSRFTFMSGLFGALSGFVGVWLASAFGLPAGPIVVLTGGIVFVVTLILKR